MKCHAFVLLAALVGLAQAADRPAQRRPPDEPIAIKGMFIGMTTKQYIAQPKVEPTIGGVRPKSEFGDGFELEWAGGELEALTFVFNPAGFDEVVRAVKSKYQRLTGTDSRVQNRAGATYSQTSCLLKQAGASLFIQRYSGDLDTSTLKLQSDAALERFLKHQQKNATDI